VSVIDETSFTVYGDAQPVAGLRRDLVAQFGVDRSALYCRAAGWTVAELLEQFLVAEHAWSMAGVDDRTEPVA
jgi:hypothetical protein